MVKTLLKYLVLLMLFCLAKNSVAELASYKNKSGLEPGFLHVTPKDKLFYLLARTNIPNSPLVIYLAGGPGASSMAPAFLANGPWIFSHPFAHNTDFQLIKNQWSWNRIANIVYLDQPRYVGYSYGNGPYITSINEAGHDFLKWLLSFYKRYPEFKNRSLYLTGESFAGVYIAEYTHQILQYNYKHLKNKINLSGLFIQSGVIGDDNRFGLDVSPYTQLSFLCSQNMLPSSACNNSEKDNLRHVLSLCMTYISQTKKISFSKVKISDIYTVGKSNKSCDIYLENITTDAQTQPFTIPDNLKFPKHLKGQTVKEPINKMEFSKNSIIRRYLAYSPNPWNMSLICQASGGFPPWCYDNYKMTQFFNNSAIKLWLGKGLIPTKTQWEFAKFLIPVALLGEKLPIWPIERYYVETLQHNIPIVFAFGKNDWDINYISAQVIINQISYRAYGRLLFKQIPEKLTDMNKFILQNDRQIGEYQSFENITFAQIDNAGHMIGMDQPEAAYKLFSLLLSQSQSPSNSVSLLSNTANRKS